MTTTVNSQAYMDGPHGPQAYYSYSPSGFEFTLYNPPSSNNYMDQYAEMNQYWVTSAPDSIFYFQGYLIYQITSISDYSQEFANNYFVQEQALSNTNYFRLVAQSDINDSLTDFTNHFYDSTLMQCNSVNVISNAANNGITHNYTIFEDAFTGQPFQAGNQYCFLFLAYAANPFYQDTACFDLRPVKLSRMGVTGSLFKICLDPATTGITNNFEDKINVFYDLGINILSETKGNFNLYTLDGKLLFQEDFQNDEKYLVNFVPGIYLYTIQTERGSRSGKLSIN